MEKEDSIDQALSIDTKKVVDDDSSDSEND